MEGKGVQGTFQAMKVTMQPIRSWDKSTTCFETPGQEAKRQTSGMFEKLLARFLAFLLRVSSYSWRARTGIETWSCKSSYQYKSKTVSQGTQTEQADANCARRCERFSREMQLTLAEAPSRYTRGGRCLRIVNSFTAVSSGDSVQRGGVLAKRRERYHNIWHVLSLRRPSRWRGIRLMHIAFTGATQRSQCYGTYQFCSWLPADNWLFKVKGNAT